MNKDICESSAGDSLAGLLASPSQRLRPYSSSRSRLIKFITFSTLATLLQMKYGHADTITLPSPRAALLN